MHWNRTKNAKHELVMSLEDQDEFPEEFARRFYHPICSDQEIDRIFDVKSAKDFLLKTRANTAVDNMGNYILDVTEIGSYLCLDRPVFDRLISRQRWLPLALTS